MTSGYLQRNPNPNAPVRGDGLRYWGHPTRTAKVQVIVIHTAETSPTTVSAEAVAHYFTHSTRPASYHEIVDSESTVQLLPPDATAFGAVGWNANGWHLSFATHAHLWGRNPAWDDAALRRGAARARKAAEHFGIPVRRINLAQANAGAEGFIDHARVDPGRRYDPGDKFPWALFLRQVEGHSPAPKPQPSPLEAIMSAGEKQLQALADQTGRLADAKRAEAQTRVAQAVAKIRSHYGREADPHSDAIHAVRVVNGSVTLEDVAERLKVTA